MRFKNHKLFSPPKIHYSLRQFLKIDESAQTVILPSKLNTSINTNRVVQQFYQARAVDEKTPSWSCKGFW